MNAEAFDGPENDLSLAELPLALQAYAAGSFAPVTLTPGTPGLDVVIAAELYPWQAS